MDYINGVTPTILLVRYTVSPGVRDISAAVSAVNSCLNRLRYSNKMHGNVQDYATVAINTEK